jgi:integrase
MQITFQKAADQYLKDIVARNRKPARPSTVTDFRYRINAHINPRLGAQDISTFTVLDMRNFVNDLVEQDLAPKTVNCTVDLLKRIIGNVRDENLNPVFPIKFDSDLIDLPIVDPRQQRRDVATKDQIEEALAAKDGSQLLYVLAAATGLRIGELMAVRVGGTSDNVSHWRPSTASVVVRTQLWRGTEVPLKTSSAWREVEIPNEVNDYIKDHSILYRDSEHLFPFSESVARSRARLRGVTGFHSFRRFFMTSLNGVPDAVRRFWMGHSNFTDVHQGYDMLASDPQKRREIRDATPTGFKLS